MRAFRGLMSWAMVVISMIACAPPSWAQGGPPLLTDDAETTPKGHWEINLAGSVEHTRSARSYELPLADVNYGIGPRAQFKWEFPWIWQQRPGSSAVNGLGDSTVGVRYRFLDEDRRHPMASVYPQFSFNNARSSVHRGLVDRETTFLLPLEVQKDLGPVAVNIEVGYNVHWGGADEWLWGVALGHEVNSRLELIGEVHNLAQVGRHEQVTVIDVGCRYRLDPARQLLFAVGTGLRGPAEDRPSITGYLGIKLER